MSSSQIWNRQSLLFAGLLAVSAIVLLTTANEWLKVNREFVSASQDLGQCQQLVREIAGLRHRPRVASLESESPQQTIGRVIEAQGQCQIAPQSLVAVSPTAPTRLGNTEYQVRTTELVLQQVALDQLHRFASALGRNDDGQVVRELSLTPEPARNAIASNGLELWNTRLILTQLIYSPTSK